MRLYVGNLPYQIAESDLQDWFSQAGVSVDSVSLVRDRFSGEARGFGFVEIENQEAAESAIRACNGKQFMGRAIVVNEARPQAPREGGGGGGGRPRGGGGGGGRGGSRRPPRW
ncbi:MAG: RNA recognition motif domain-containing protein [Bryobacteraceae bacterium]